MKIRHKVHTLLHNPSGNNRGAVWINRGLATLILANVAAVVLETVPEFSDNFKKFFVAFEAASTLVFLLEYILRLWAAVEQKGLEAPISGRLRWMSRPLSLLDLAVILTYFAPIDVRYFRLFRLLRLFRVFRLPKLAASYDHLQKSIAQRSELLVLSAILMCITVISSAALLYFFEHSAQPKAFSSIPAAIWWAIMTLTTVGYGDIYPVTAAGKICASFIAVLGIGVFALPAAILTGAVIEASTMKTSTDIKCPNCGKSLQRDE
jgi:voltage-gated potassium channel